MAEVPVLNWHVSVLISILVCLVLLGLLQPRHRARLPPASSSRNSSSSNSFSSAYFSQVYACLAHRHVVFLGDLTTPTTRYQYLTLVYALEYGRFPGHGQVRNLCDDLSWGKPPGRKLQRGGGHRKTTPFLPDVEYWRRYHSELSSKGFRGHEVCDCEGSGGESANTVENRYYRHPQRSLAVTFLRWAPPLRGHCLSNGTLVLRPCEPGRLLPATGGLRWAWQQGRSESDLVNSVVTRDLRPSDLILPLPLLLTTSVSEGLGSGGRVVGVVTTPSKRGDLQGKGRLLLDAWNLTRKYVQRPSKSHSYLIGGGGGDGGGGSELPHFICPVYNELNQKLLQLLCPPPIGSGLTNLTQKPVK